MSSKENEEKKGPAVEWFAQCQNNDSNRALGEALAAHGFGYEGVSECKAVRCYDGRRRKFFRLPDGFVTLVLTSKQGSDVLKFRLWKRNGRNAKAYPGDFLEQGKLKQGPRYRSAADKLKAIKAARDGEQADADKPAF